MVENDCASYTDFQRYLAAKKSVDDRALNHHVWQNLWERTRTAAQHSSSLRIIEIGAGIGTMVERILEWGLVTEANYVLVDEIADNIATARRRLPLWAVAAGFTATPLQGAQVMLLLTRAATLETPAARITIEFVEADCLQYAIQAVHQQSADLLIAHAVLDLFDIPSALWQLKQLLKPAALFYATINFDGNTILQPEIDRIFDAQIEAAYHATMDNRITNGLPSGDSQSGRHLFGHLRATGLSLLDAGSSDWVVFAGPHGYPADEAYFLHFLVQTMDGALQHDTKLDPERFAAWIKERHAQIERGELVYVAHQLDFLAQLI